MRPRSPIGALLMAVSLVLTGCATTGGPARQAQWSPTIDPQGVKQSRYEADLAECRQLATERGGTDAKAETKKGAMRGGLGMAALVGVGVIATGGLAGLAMLPAVAGGTAMTVGSGAATGALVGNNLAETKYRSTISSCLSGRGYHVIG